MALDLVPGGAEDRTGNDHVLIEPDVDREILGGLKCLLGGVVGPGGERRRVAEPDQPTQAQLAAELLHAEIPDGYADRRPHDRGGEEQAWSREKGNEQGNLPSSSATSADRVPQPPI